MAQHTRIVSYSRRRGSSILDEQSLNRGEIAHLPHPPINTYPYSRRWGQLMLSPVLAITFLIACAITIHLFQSKANDGVSSDIPVQHFEYDDVSSYHRKLSEAGIERYELLHGVLPSIRRALILAKGQQSFTFDLQVPNRSYNISLTRASTIFSPDYRHYIYRNGGFEIDYGFNLECVFEVHIEGDPGSFGSAVLCDDEDVQITMLHARNYTRSFSLLALAADTHVFYEHQDQQDISASKIICDHNDHYTQKTPRSQHDLSTLREEGHFTPAEAIGAHFIGKRNKTVRMLVVNDVARYKHFTTPSKVEQSTTSIMSLVRSIYAQIYSEEMYGVNVEIAMQITFKDKDGWNTTQYGSEVDSQRLLADFNNWKSDLTSENFDVAHLFSGRVFVNGTVGRTFLGGICQPQNSAVDQISGYPDAIYAKIVAHELAHQLGGLPHDDTYDDEECSSNTNTYVWSSISQQDNTQWSKCSLKTMKAFFENNSIFPYLGCLEDEYEAPKPTVKPTTKAPTRKQSLTGSPTSTASPFASGPTASPTIFIPDMSEPVGQPTWSPSLSPQVSPTQSPTSLSTKEPLSPTVYPSDSPTASPSRSLESISPSILPTSSPSLQPTSRPSDTPTLYSPVPSRSPSLTPTSAPSLEDTSTYSPSSPPLRPTSSPVPALETNNHNVTSTTKTSSGDVSLILGALSMLLLASAIVYILFCRNKASRNTTNAGDATSFSRAIETILSIPSTLVSSMHTRTRVSEHNHQAKDVNMEEGPVEYPPKPVRYSSEDSAASASSASNNLASSLGSAADLPIVDARSVFDTESQATVGHENEQLSFSRDNTLPLPIPPQYIDDLQFRADYDLL